MLHGDVSKKKAFFFYRCGYCYHADKKGIKNIIFIFPFALLWICATKRKYYSGFYLLLLTGRKLFLSLLIVFVFVFKKNHDNYQKRCYSYSLHKLLQKIFLHSIRKRKMLSTRDLATYRVIVLFFVQLHLNFFSFVSSVTATSTMKKRKYWLSPTKQK